MTAVVAGLGRTPLRRRPHATAAALAAQAIVAALRDARVPASEVDGAARFDRDALWEYDLPGVLGVANLHWYAAVPFGPGSAPALLRLAAMAITQGLATTVLCWHARDGAEPPDPAFATAAALAARRHGVTEAEIARSTIAHRRAALRNAHAAVRAPLTAADRRRSPYVAEPLRAVDLARPASGACAFVVTSAERARRSAVAIAGSMQVALPSAVRHPVEWCSGRPLEAVARAGRTMFRRARVDPADVQVACVDAGASALVPLALRTFRVARARVNPHGGQLCEGMLDGVGDVAEAVRQLRGDAASAVRGARLALAAGSLLEPTSAVLLAKP